MRLCRRSATDIESASRVVAIVFKKPSAARSPPTLAHLVTEHRIVFDPMAIAIDDRMVDFRTDLFRGHMRAHDLLRKNCGSTHMIVRPARALCHKRSAPSVARSATPPVIRAG